MNKELANRIKKITEEGTIDIDLRQRGRILLKDYFLNKNNTKILVVDDVVSNVLLLKIILNNEGYNVCTANSGKTCIEAAYNEKPDIILLDTSLPDLNSFDVAVKLKNDSATKETFANWAKDVYSKIKNELPAGFVQNDLDLLDEVVSELCGITLIEKGTIRSRLG